jgi:DNA-binding NarL/FixJ family response regulator
MNILVVDDHQIFRKAFIRLLKISVDQGIVCDEAQNGQDAIDQIQNKHFDLVFLDVSMPQMDGVEACRRIREGHPNVAVIMLTQFDNESLIFHFFNIGVQSFLSKDTSVEELKLAIKGVLIGKKYFPPVINKIIQKKVCESNTLSIQKIELTFQEKQLLLFLQAGLTSKEAAERMNLTDKTVRTYKERLMEKTNTRNVAELITFGFRNGILR